MFILFICFSCVCVPDGKVLQKEHYLEEVSEDSKALGPPVSGKLKGRDKTSAQIEIYN